MRSKSDPLYALKHHIRLFVRSNLPEFTEDVREYRPASGYGHFHRSNEVYGILFDFINNLSRFQNPIIPSEFPSPDALVKAVTEMWREMEKIELILIEICKAFKNPAEIPLPLDAALRMTGKTKEAFRYALTLYDSPANVRKFQKPNTNQEQKYKKKYEDLLAKLQNKIRARWEILFKVVLGMIPVGIFSYLLFLIINPGLCWRDPLTYIDQESWGKLEAVIFIAEILIIPMVVYVYRGAGKRLANYLASKHTFEQGANDS